MGKKLIIKDADFSQNALESGSIEWLETQFIKPFIITNPSSATFGKLSDVATTSTSYKKMARLASTIAVPAGKKILIRVDNINNEPRNFYASMLYYGSAWTSDPTSSLPAVSINYDDENFKVRQEYINNSNEIQYIQATCYIENVNNLDVSNYIVYYAIV